MDDQNTQSEPVSEAPVQTSEPASAIVEPESSQPKGSTPTDLPPEAPESPMNDVPSIPVESQNGEVNEPESKPVEPPKELQGEVVSATSVQPVPVPAPQAAVAPQTESPAQQDQKGFIRSLLIKAQAKIQSNRQKKLELLMQAVSKKGKIDNREAQKLLRISDKTAERYLNKLVTQERLKRSGAGRDVIYKLT